MDENDFATFPLNNSKKNDNQNSIFFSNKNINTFNIFVISDMFFIFEHHFVRIFLDWSLCAMVFDAKPFEPYINETSVSWSYLISHES